MKALSFIETALVYACANDHRAGVHIVQHEVLEEYSLALQALLRKLGPMEQESYWKQLLSPFRRYRFALSSMPLPFNSELCVPPALNAAATVDAQRCKSIYPHLAPDVARVAELATELARASDAPLLDALRAVLGDAEPSASVGVLLRTLADAQLRGELRTALGRNVVVLPPSAVSTMDPVDHLIVIGVFAWFPEHVRTAPRYRLATTVRYAWMREGRDVTASFVASARDQFKLPHPSAITSEHLRRAAAIEAAELAPTLDWAQIRSEVTKEKPITPGEEDEVLDARLLALSGGLAVLVDASADARVQVIDLADDERVVRMATQELQAGAYILLRTGGGGDLVAPVADRILGQKAMEVRATQMRWKRALRNLVVQKGEDQVRRLIAGLGSTRATRGNLRYWMSERTIRPDFDDDFLAVLLVCGLDGDTKLFMDNARLLDRVHRKAGFRIRQMLLEQVDRADLSKLAADGQMDFGLPAAVGGSFSAYRIEEIAPTTYPTPIGHIGHPTRIPGGTWQG